MKKALAILTALAVVGGAAFAEISVGGWGRAVFVPLANSGAEDVDSTSHLGTSWTEGGPRIGFTVAGNSDNVGFQIDMNADPVFDTDPDNNYVAFGDQAKIWVKPVDMVTLTVGRFKEDTLRGNGTFGVFDWYRAYGTGTGEDLTFTRIESDNGLVVTATPVEGLFAAFALKELDADTENLAKKMQLAAGYTIADVGQIRAQYISDYAEVLGKEFNYGVMEVAFKLSAVENLYADFGFAMGMGDADADMNVSAYANYKVSEAVVHALADVTIPEEGDTEMELGVGANYGLSNGIGLVGDVRYMNDAKVGGADSKITFFAGATKGFSNGVLGAGVEVSSSTDTGYAIPVRFEYSF